MKSDNKKKARSQPGSYIISGIAQKGYDAQLGSKGYLYTKSQKDIYCSSLETAMTNFIFKFKMAAWRVYCFSDGTKNGMLHN